MNGGCYLPAVVNSLFSREVSLLLLRVITSCKKIFHQKVPCTLVQQGVLLYKLKCVNTQEASLFAMTSYREIQETSHHVA